MPSGAATILNVEDDPITRVALSTVLHNAGFQVKEAGTGADALEQVAHNPNIILLDIQLPDMDGRDVCRRIKAVPRATPPLIVVVSGVYMGRDDRIRALTDGADAYFTKPIDPEELLATLHALLRIQRAEQEAVRARTEADAVRTQLAAIVDGSSDAIFTKTLDGIITSWNEGAESLYGFTRDDIIGHPVSLLVPPEKAAEQNSVMTRLRAGERLPPFDTVRMHKNGHRLDVSVNVSPFRDRFGALLGASVIARDIGDRKRAEQAAHDSEVRKTAMLQAALDAIITIDRQGQVVEFNPAAERMFGYARASVLGRPVGDLIVPPAARDAHRRGLQRYLDSGEGKLIGRRVEIMACHADGHEFPVELAITRVPVGRTELFMAFVRDRSEQRSLEQQFRQAQKMEAVGQLAGGLAHDFNNILTLIIGNAQLLQVKLGPTSPVQRVAQEIRGAGERAAALTQQLLAFCRKQAISPRVLDLNEVVTNLSEMLRRTLGEQIGLITCLFPDLGRVRADPVQMEQVLLNLVINARDAMPGGGKLTIGTQNLEVDEAYTVAHPGISPGKFVLLSVRDTGSGMDQSTLDRIFEPFFTTKGAGKGTGLGLATVWGIITHHGGFIDVSSTLGVGTTFQVLLPRLDVGRKTIPRRGPLE